MKWNLGKLLIEVEWSMEREEEWNERRETICM